MLQTKRLYETTFIVNASIEDTQIEAVISHILDTITGNGGEIAAVNRWGRKRLAYVIQKKNSGYYVNVEFQAFGPLVERLEHVFLLDENVLRFLTIQIDKRAMSARAKNAAQMAPAEAGMPSAAAVPATAAPATAAPAAVVAADPAREPLFSNDTDRKAG